MKRPSSTSARTGRAPEQVAAIEAYYKAQGMFGMPQAGDIDYSEMVELDLASDRAQRCPARSARRTASNSRTSRRKFDELLSEAVAENGYGKRRGRARPTCTRRSQPASTSAHGDVLIAAITSCTNTSNPERDARGRPAREESSRSGPEGAPAREDVAGARARASSPST